MILSDLLRAKIRRRATRAFGGASVHRIVGPSKGVPNKLHYRLPGSLFGYGLRQGPKLLIRQDKLNRVYVPRITDASL